MLSLQQLLDGRQIMKPDAAHLFVLPSLVFSLWEVVLYSSLYPTLFFLIVAGLFFTVCLPVSGIFTKK